MAHRLSVMDRIDPRSRIVAASAFAIVVVLCHQMPPLLISLLIALLAAKLAKLHVKRTLRRVLAMDLFIVFMLFTLPFTLPGTPMFSVFGLSASVEGFLKAVEIGLKANAIVLMLLATVGTLDASTLGHALARLGTPEKLVHLLLFTVRYLDVISREYRRMRAAMKARAFVPKSNRHTWRSIGYLLGMLLVRSLERSERIYAAMLCRGYKGRLYLLDELQFTPIDAYFALGFSACLGVIIGSSF